MGRTEKNEEKDMTIRLPWKAGDKVWVYYSKDGAIEEKVVSGVYIGDDYDFLSFTDGGMYTIWDKAWHEHIGEYLFYSEEEAIERTKETEEEFVCAECVIRPQGSIIGSDSVYEDDGK